MKEYLTDVLEDNEHIKAVLINIAIAITLGFLVEYVTGLNESPFKGGLIVAFAFMDMFGLLLVASSNMKDDRQYNIEGLQARAIEAEAQANGATIAKDKANGLALQLNEMLEAEQGLTESLAKEVEILRKGERERIAKIEKAGAEIEKAMSEIEKHQTEYQKVVADYEKAGVETEKGKAEIEKLKAEIEKAKADNQKLKKSFEATLLDNEPIIKLGYTYIDYRTNKSLNASNSITEEDRRVAKKAFDDAKASLDEFMNNYKN